MRQLMARKRNAKPVALIAGASRGIGRAVALRLAQDGYDLSLVSRQAHPHLLATAAACRRLGAQVLALDADLLKPEQAKSVVEKTVAHFACFDALVHCVGDYLESSLEKLKTTQWKAMFQSNLDTAFYTSQAALPLMRRNKKGRVVFFGLAGVHRPRKSIAAYAAAKSALVSYARSLAIEEAGRGITVNIVSPGIVPHEASHSSTRSRKLLASIPMGRAGRPEELAAAVAFLLSKDADYLTGADLPVSGGWML